MKGIRLNFIIDKLTLCYTTDEANYERLLNLNYEDYGEFVIKRCNDEDKFYRDSFVIYIKEIDNENGGIKYINFGCLKLNLLIEREYNNENKYVWVYINNECLYTNLYKNVNIIIYMDYIADVLNIELNNVTSMDISLDSNINYAKRLKKAVFNDDLDIILNGKLKNNKEETLNEILYLHTANRKRYTNLTVYIKQQSKDGFKLCLYDKSRELEKSKKYYISKWYQIDKNNFRSEIRLKAEHIKKYLLAIKCPLNMILLKLNEQEFLFNMFTHFANRLIRFRDSRKNLYSFIDL